MYNHIKHMLQEGQVINVEFTKKNGETRKMKCTTNPKLIPESLQPTGDNSNYQSEAIFRVYDVEAEGWRSFRTDSVKVVTTQSL